MIINEYTIVQYCRCPLGAAVYRIESNFFDQKKKKTETLMSDADTLTTIGVNMMTIHFNHGE